ncbi:MAG: NAD(P)H-dependent oxidoreductase [Lachnospiraceae bacterium]|nr:NAD(P)H-dependent oxidoreductase [Lachnospiraceae bacterium]
MSLVVLNGSPKKSRSSTAAIIQGIKEIIGNDITVFQAVDFMRKADVENETVIAEILKADTLLIVFPLYVDALPMPLVTIMQCLEKKAKALKSMPKVYAICHCGFYEASQNETALRMIYNFCNRTGFSWQYGVGIGAGVFLGGAKEIKKGPTKEIFNVLCSLCSAVKGNLNEKKENVFIMPSVPRLIYIFGGNMGWKRQAKNNGVSDKLRSTPFANKALN